VPFYPFDSCILRGTLHVKAASFIHPVPKFRAAACVLFHENAVGLHKDSVAVGYSVRNCSTLNNAIPLDYIGNRFRFGSWWKHLAALAFGVAAGKDKG
jgi:hypothetical protein